MEAIKVKLPISFEKPIIALKIAETERCLDLVNKGEVHFSKPSSWRNEFSNQGSQLDQDEGLICKSFEPNPVLKNKYIECVENNAFKYYSKEENVFSCCFYGINRSSFVGPIMNNTGVPQHEFVIKGDYFSKFNPKLKKCDYEKMEERPSVVLIFDFWNFLDRVINTLKEIGCSESEIFYQPVYYVNKKTFFCSNMPHPMEFFLKDDSFREQSEFRILICTKSKRALDYLSQHNNNIYIGDISKTSTIQDYYFKDLNIGIQGNKLLYELAVPIETRLDESSFKELVGILIQVQDNRLPQGKLNEKELDEMMTSIENIIKRKYGVDYIRETRSFLNVPLNLLNEIKE